MRSEGENARTNSCENLKKKLQKAQFLLSDEELQARTGSVIWNGSSISTLGELHNIDPELVRREFERWAERVSVVRGTNEHDSFPNLLHEEEKQKAIDYVTRIPLDQHSTNLLLIQVIALVWLGLSFLSQNYINKLFYWTLECQLMIRRNRTPLYTLVSLACNSRSVQQTGKSSHLELF
jgi:hypothetical protein